MWSCSWIIWLIFQLKFEGRKSWINKAGNISQRKLLKSWLLCNMFQLPHLRSIIIIINHHPLLLSRPMSHVILNKWLFFYSTFFNIWWSGVLTSDSTAGLDINFISCLLWQVVEKSTCPALFFGCPNFSLYAL